MPRIIGITGNIACGKSSVGQMLLELGAAHYIDADLLVHRLYEKDQLVAQQVAEIFGPSIMAADGSIDRQALGRIVFRDPAALRQLESLVHPAVREALLGELEKVSTSEIVVIDAVKLLESSSAALCQSKWLVICSPEQEMARLITRNHISQDEAEARLRAQPDVASKLALVDEVIDNSGSLAHTRQQVVAAFASFIQ